MRKIQAILNEKMTYQVYEQKEQKQIYAWCVVSALLAGKGFSHTSDLVKQITKYTSISRRTAYRYIDMLLNLGLLKRSYHKGNKEKNIKSGYILRVKGRTYLETLYDHNDRYFIVDEYSLSSYANFQRFIIRQTALLRQRRFKYAYKELENSNFAACRKKTGTIDSICILKGKHQVGCSISKVQEKLNIDKRIISQALRGFTVKQKNSTLPIDGKVARKKYGDLINGLAGDARIRYGCDVFGNVVRIHTNQVDHRLSFTYNSSKDTYTFHYSIASLIINVDSSSRRIKSKDLKMEPGI